MATQKRLRILIVDDNEMIRRALRMIVQSDAYEVIGTASCGKTGWEQIDKLRPDIVLLDINMPNSNGLIVLEQIKQALPQTVVLMVTADSDQKTVQTALRRGANGFIIKPFKSGTVIDALQSALRCFQCNVASQPAAPCAYFGVLQPIVESIPMRASGTMD